MRDVILENHKQKMYRGMPWWVCISTWVFLIVSLILLLGMMVLNHSIVNLQFRYVIVDHSGEKTNCYHAGPFGIYTVVANFVILGLLVLSTIKVWKFGDHYINGILLSLAILSFIYLVLHCLGILWYVMPLVPIYSSYVYDTADDWKLEYTLQPFLYAEMCLQVLNIALIGIFNIYYFNYYKKL
jgi:phosphatidylserine synthase